MGHSKARLWLSAPRLNSESWGGPGAPRGAAPEGLEAAALYPLIC